jgi:hypothetical protein
MRNIYGLNYLGAATLDQAYQDKLKTFNGNSADADEYFSGSEWKETLEGFKNNPDYNNSTELTMFRDVADIKKYTYDIGQWHLDRKMPEIAEELKRAFLEARGTGTTRDPYQGRHPNPYPPEEKPAPSTGSGVSIRTPEPNFPPEEKFDPVTATPQRLRKEADLWEAKGKPGFARNFRDEADNRESLLIRDINANTKVSTANLFSENFGDKGIPLLPWTWGGAADERRRMNAIRNTIGDALISGDYAQFDAAKEISETLYRHGKDEKTGDPYNRANTFNSLADFGGDVIGMLNAMRSFIKETEDAAERMSKLEASLEIKD